MITRRRFLAGSLATAVGSLVPYRLLAEGSRNTRVVVVTDANVVSGTTVNASVVTQMVNAGIKQLTGQPTIGQAWYSLLPGITASSKVSLKENLSNGEVAGAAKAIVHPAVTNAIVEGLRQMPTTGGQIPLENIMVWDLDKSPIVASGYTINLGGPGLQCYYAIESWSPWYVGDGLGFDSSYTCTVDHSGTYADTYHHPTNIITNYSDYMLNGAILGLHYYWNPSAGMYFGAKVTGVLKNNYGSFDTIGISRMHEYGPGYVYDGYSEGIPSVNAFIRDYLGNRQRLFFIDGIFGCCTQGPQRPVDCTPKTLIFGTDPVAVDYEMTQILNYHRSLLGSGPINPDHVAAAAGPPFNLGTNNPAQIDLIQITNPSVPPPQVQNVRAAHGGADVIISWDAVPGVSNYNVYRHSTAYPQAPGALVGSTVSTTYTHVGAAVDPSGFYTVTAEY